MIYLDEDGLPLTMDLHLIKCPGLCGSGRLGRRGYDLWPFAELLEQAAERVGPVLIYPMNDAGRPGSGLSLALGPLAGGNCTAQLPAPSFNLTRNLKSKSL